MTEIWLPSPLIIGMIAVFAFAVYLAGVKRL